MSRYSGNWIRPVRRHAIYARDLDTCAWCGNSVFYDDATLDHVHPVAHPLHAHGATDLVTACRPCNSRRQDMELVDWLILLAQEGRDMTAVLLRLDRRRLTLDIQEGKRHLAIAREGGWAVPF